MLLTAGEAARDRQGHMRAAHISASFCFFFFFFCFILNKISEGGDMTMCHCSTGRSSHTSVQSDTAHCLPSAPTQTLSLHKSSSFTKSL